MDSFKSKYPCFTALFALIAAATTKLFVSGETLVQKIESEITLVPQELAFFPMASGLKAELASLKSSPTDMEAGLEVLVSDFAFSGAKAQAVMPKAFLFAEKIAESVEPGIDLVEALKG